MSNQPPIVPWPQDEPTSYGQLPQASDPNYGGSSYGQVPPYGQPSPYTSPAPYAEATRGGSRAGVVSVIVGVGVICAVAIGGLFYVVHSPVPVGHVSALPVATNPTSELPIASASAVPEVPEVPVPEWPDGVPDSDAPPFATATDGVYGLDMFAYFDAQVSVEGGPVGEGWTLRSSDPSVWGDGACALTPAESTVNSFGDPTSDQTDRTWTDENLQTRVFFTQKYVDNLAQSGDPFVFTIPVSDGNVIEFTGIPYTFNRQETGTPGIAVVVGRALSWHDQTFEFTFVCDDPAAVPDPQGYVQGALQGFVLTLS